MWTIALKGERISPYKRTVLTEGRLNQLSAVEWSNLKGQLAPSPIRAHGRLIAGAIPTGNRPHSGLRASCSCLCGFLIGHLDRGLEPVRLDDQEVARHVLKGPFGRCADENPLPAVSRHGAHHDDVSIHFLHHER